MILPLDMDQALPELKEQLICLLRSDTARMEMLQAVEQVIPGEGWIGGGFIRNMVWDFLGGKDHPLNDVDVIYLGNGTRVLETNYSQSLRYMGRDIQWSVKDQARMAVKHGHSPYLSIGEALSFWVEKCTAVAVRLEGNDLLVESPYGLEQLFQGIISPSHPDLAETMRDRISQKRWLVDYPFLVVQSE